MNAATQVLLPDAKESREVEIDSLLLRDRVIFLGDAVRSDSANILIKQLLYLERVDPKTPITLYLNSPGGSVVDGMAIYDTIRRLSCPVHAVVAGDFAGSPAGSCIARVVRTARFAPFSKPRFRVIYPFSL